MAPDFIPEHRDRVAIVTGGAGAIGRAIAERLQAAGASVHVLDVAPLAAGSPPGCPPIRYHRVDVSREEEVEAAFDSIGSERGRLDYLICCAAIFPARPFLDLSEEEWRRTLEVNLSGSFLCCRAALRRMLPQEFGRIVLFSSMLARTGGANCAPYAASKGGILGLARSLALEVASANLRVSTISPAITDTPQPRGHMSEEELRARGARIPLGRIGQVADMVEACMFLLSEESSYVTGQDLRVNGGSALW